jgi:hypothetical protein
MFLLPQTPFGTAFKAECGPVSNRKDVKVVVSRWGHKLPFVLDVKKKKKQIDVNHTQGEIIRGHKPTGQGEGGQRGGKWRRVKTALDVE